MSNYRNTQDLKQAVLKHAGELTNGTSTYDADALFYLDNLHRDLLAGGNEFGIDTAEQWTWAKAKRPIILTLEPAYATGSVTVTQGSMAGSFSVAPTESLAGWFLKIEARDEYFIIAAHVAGQSAFSLDQGYTEDSGSFVFKAIKLDYELKDDTVLIDTSNYLLDFSENGVSKSTILTQGMYTASDYIAHVADRMQNVSTGGTYASSFDETTRFFTITGTLSFGFLFASGGSASISSAYFDLGFVQADQSSALTQTSLYPLNAIQRLIRPMTTYRAQEFGYQAPVDAGKIYGIDYNTMLRKFPIMQICMQMPAKFAEISYSQTGLITVRFDSYPQLLTRVEVDYIPVGRTLQDNTVNCPLVPQAYRDYLVFGATYYIMIDKSDDRGIAYGVLAEKKLSALLNNNRKKGVVTGNNYARLVPRGMNQRRYRVYSTEED